MFTRRFLKYIASLVFVGYVSILNAECVLAANLDFYEPITPLLVAQATDAAGNFVPTTQAEKDAQQAVYFSKIQRLESDIQRKRGSRNTLMTVTISSALIGAGVALGSSKVYDEVKKINPGEESQQRDIDSALDALDLSQSVGWGIVGLGGASLLGYLLYSAAIGGQQREVDALYDAQAELSTRRGEFSEYLPEYLQENEAANQLWDDIAVTKKSAGSSRSFASFFNRLAIGTILSGGFLYSLSSLTNNVVDQIEIREVDGAGNITPEGEAKQNAIDAADGLQIAGLGLLGAGLASGITGYFFNRSAKKKDQEINELENRILLIADRINIQPTRNGFMLSYSYQFK